MVLIFKENIAGETRNKTFREKRITQDFSYEQKYLTHQVPKFTIHSFNEDFKLGSGQFAALEHWYR